MFYQKTNTMGLTLLIATVMTVGLAMPAFAHETEEVTTNSTESPLATVTSTPTISPEALLRKKALEQKKEAAKKIDNPGSRAKVNAIEAKAGEQLAGLAEQRKEAQTKKQEFQKKIGEIKDAKKAEVAKRLDAQLAKINTKHTESKLRRLELLMKINQKIKARIDKVAAANDETDAVLALFQASEENLAALKAKLELQKEKSYTVSFDNEAKLGQAFHTALEGLKADQESLGKQLNSAKDSIQATFKALGELTGGESKTISPSPTLSPSASAKQSERE